MTVSTTAPRKLRVMHVLHSLGAGGAEKIVHDLALGQQERLETAVICLDELGPLARPLQDLGAEVACTSRAPGLDLRQITRIAECIRRFRPDVIHAHQYTPYFYSALAASCAGFGRIIFTEHGRHYPDLVSHKRRVVNQLLRLRRDRITAVCKFVAHAVSSRERLGRDVRVIHNGIDWPALSRPRKPAWLRRQINAPSDAVVAIHVGRFHPVKDHATCVRAFAAARDHGSDIHRLVLVGQGQLEEEIRGLIAELRLEQCVHLLGLRSDVPDLLAASDLFISSSVSEGACLAILEAMAAGLPVAATDVGGNSELIIHGRTGLLSTPGDADALAASMKRLFADAHMRRDMGSAGIDRVRREFSQAAMHQSLLGLYTQLAGDRP